MENKLIVITATYNRPNRLQMMGHLKSILETKDDIYWIVVEDADQKDPELESFLPAAFTTYLNVGPTNDLGHVQRNMALEFIYDNKISGVIYNADDDNWYHPDLFDEIKRTKRISIFPVGNLGPNGIERPIVQNGKFVDWDAYWLSRKFPVDMAGFAFHSDVLNELEKPFWLFYGRGGESEFIAKFTQSIEEVEFLCDDCTKVLVKHNELRNS